MPNIRNQSDHHSLCKKFNAKSTVIRDQETQDGLIDTFFKHDSCVTYESKCNETNL